MKIRLLNVLFGERGYIHMVSTMAAKFLENGKTLGKSDFCGRDRKFFPCFLQFPLAFAGPLADTSGNTLAAPLFRMVMCLRNDVHQGRVELEQPARSELNRITAAPPLMPLWHNAVLGRLLLFGDLPFLRGGRR